MPYQKRKGGWIVPVCDPRNPKIVLGGILFPTEEEANEMEKDILQKEINKIEEERRAQ